MTIDCESEYLNSVCLSININLKTLKKFVQALEYFKGLNLMVCGLSRNLNVINHLPSNSLFSHRSETLK